jgi:hypothetical protein
MSKRSKPKEHDHWFDVISKRLWVFREGHWHDYGISSEEDCPMRIPIWACCVRDPMHGEFECTEHCLYE